MAGGIPSRPSPISSGLHLQQASDGYNSSLLVMMVSSAASRRHHHSGGPNAFAARSPQDQHPVPRPQMAAVRGLSIFFSDSGTPYPGPHLPAHHESSRQPLRRGPGSWTARLSRLLPRSFIGGALYIMGSSRRVRALGFGRIGVRRLRQVNPIQFSPLGPLS
jgi:hypothetical protein